jgi:co-chaperonin GroES (HSP10)
MFLLADKTLMMQPIGNKILVKPFAYSEKSQGGIFIPNQRLDANNNLEIVKAEVVAVGPGHYSKEGVFIENSIKVGMIIGFGGRQYSGTEVEEDGVKYRLLREEDALMVFEDEGVKHD